MEGEPAASILHFAADGQIPASGEKRVVALEKNGVLEGFKRAVEVPDLSQVTLHLFIDLARHFP